jgi:hypothetical protein
MIETITNNLSIPNVLKQTKAVDLRKNINISKYNQEWKNFAY